MIRLSERQKQFMCERIARFVKRADILKECIREFVLDDTPEVREQLYRKIDYFQTHPNARRWQEFIERARAAWLADVDSVPLASRKMRILEMARFYERCRERLATCEEEAEVDRITATALKILKEIREEADAMLKAQSSGKDGDAAYATGFEDLSDDELVETARAAGITVPEPLEQALAAPRSA